MALGQTAALNLALNLKDNASKDLGKFQDKLGGVKKTIGLLAVGATAGAGAIAGMGAAMFKLGMDAAKLEPASNTFANLAASIDTTSEALMGRLREATRGMINDAGLVAAGNQLMAMGLATNSEEAAKLAEMASQLGSAMGHEAGPAIENFTLMLANQSVERLDSFGISSGRVRMRIDELIESGQAANREEAFKLATLEIGAETMQRVGDQSQTLSGDLARMRAQFENTKVEVGQQFLPILASLAEIALPFVQKAMAAIVPIAESVAEWVGTQLPIAIESAATWFTNISGFIVNDVIPAFSATVDYIRNNIIPTIENNLTPILAGLATVLLYTVVPAFVAWAAGAATAAGATIAALAPVLIPIAAIGAAVALLVKAWEEDWGGIQTKTREVWEQHLQPIFELAKEWIGETLPVVLQTLADFWNDTLLPAINAVWSFLQEYIIPIFDAFANIWIALVKAELYLLVAAFSAVWEFINDKVWPIIEDLSDLVIEGLILQVGALSDLWKNTLYPALETVYDFVKDKVIDKFNSLKDTLNDVKSALQGAADWLGRLADKIRNLPGIPSWLQRHSPSEIEQTLMGMKELLPAVAAAFREMGDSLPDGDKLANVAGNIGSMFGAIAKMMGLQNLGEYKSPDTSILEQMAKDAAFVVDKVWEIFTRVYEPDDDGEYPGLVAFQKEAEVLSIQSNRIGSAIAIIGKMLQLKELNEYKSPDIAKIEQMAIDAALVVDKVWEIFNRIYEPNEEGEYPGLEAFQQEATVLSTQSNRIGSALAIIGKMLGLKELDDYTSPNMAIVERMLIDAALVVDKAWEIFHRVYAPDEEGNYPGLEAFQQEASVLSIHANRIGSALAILGDMLGLEEISTYKSPDLGIVERMLIDAALVVDKAWEIFHRIYAPDENGDYPGLVAFQQEAAVLSIHANRIGSALAILGDMIGLEEINDYQSPNLSIVERMLIDAALVVDKAWEVFHRIYAPDENGEYPGLIAFQQEATVLSTQAGRVGSALSIISDMLGLEDIADYTSPDLAIVELMANDAKDVTQKVYDVFGGITDDLEELKNRGEAFGVRGSIVSTALGIISSMLGMESLDDYVTPDLDKIEKVANDAMDVVDKVQIAVDDFYTNAEDMEAKAGRLTEIKTMVNDVVTMIQNTITAAEGLSEMSWREVKETDVTSFTTNLGNIVTWLTDPVIGMAAIDNLTDMSTYRNAAVSLGTIVHETVEAVKEIMTLPAVWDARMSTISTGFVSFFGTLKTTVLKKGDPFVQAWAQLAEAAIAAFIDGFGSIDLSTLWSNIAADAEGTLNDGVFRSLGLRNARAYQAGWDAGGIGFPLPPGGKMPGYATGTPYAKGGWAVVGEEGPELVNLPRGSKVLPTEKSVGNTYNLTVNSNAPVEDIVTDFEMMRAFA